jgi:hypothetical protein
MPEISINYLAVLVGGIINMALGMLWYSPVLFGKQWMALSGRTPADMEAAKQKGMTGSYIVAFIGALVMAYVLSYIVDYAHAETIVEGAQAGFWSWLGFIATTQLGIVLWEGKPKSLYMINAGYYLVSLLIMGAILAIWV